VHETGLALLEGRFSKADALIKQRHRLNERSPTAHVSTTAVVQRFPLLLEQGDLKELRPALSELAATIPANGIYRSLLARLQSEVGNDAAARDMLESLARNDWAAIPRNVEWLLAVCLVAETAWLLGDHEHASQLYDLLAPYAPLVAVSPHFFSIGSVSRYVGILAAVLSRLDEAAHRLEGAAAANARIGARPWVAHAKADHARVLLTRQAQGDREHAGELLHEALAIFGELGMTTSVDRVAALLGETTAPRPREA
jgi:hypothetical protein